MVLLKSKNLARYKSKNNYVGRLSVNNNAVKSFNILAISLNVLNIIILMIQTKFLDLFLAKFLNTSAKPFFPYKKMSHIINLL